MKPVITIAVLSIILLTAEFVMAQPGLPENPAEAPIDGGLSLLAIGGAAYAISKLKKQRQN